MGVNPPYPLNHPASLLQQVIFLDVHLSLQPILCLYDELLMMIDRCCQTHDHCYTAAMADKACTAYLDNPYTHGYQQTCDKSTKTVTCLSECIMDCYCESYDDINIVMI